MGYIPSERKVEDSFREHNSIRENYHRANRLLERRIAMLQGREDLPRLPDYNTIKDSDDVSSNLVAVMIISEEDKKIINSSEDGLLKKLYEKCVELGKHLDSSGKIAIGQNALRQNYLDKQAFAKIENKTIP